MSFELLPNYLLAIALFANVFGFMLYALIGTVKHEREQHERAIEKIKRLRSKSHNQHMFLTYGHDWYQRPIDQPRMIEQVARWREVRDWLRNAYPVETSN